MPEIKRVFSAAKMNRDKDARLVPQGEYREALNVNISKSEGADMGSVENILGNVLVGNANIPSGEAIGVYRDTGNEMIYFFVTSNSSYDGSNGGTHGIFEYDQTSKQLRTLISDADLNFHKNNKITGINLVDELLFWTDDRNPPRKINVVRARNDAAYYTAGGAGTFNNLASVAKYAPYESPSILEVGVNNEAGTAIDSNFLENKIIRFSYRWKFEDGEYSTLAPFTTSCFSRLGNTDTISAALGNFGEIETFVNAIKSVQLQIPTPPGYGITEVELIYKETGSSTLYVVEDKPVAGESFINFWYVSQDPFRTLPPDQLTRVYDAVPRVAQSQELVGGRLVYGNFLQNYNIPNIDFSVVRTGEDAARQDWGPGKNNLSLKSRRTYQVGIVLADKFGRQSPVILSNSGGDSVYISPGYGDSSSTHAFNALRITFANTNQIPSWAYSYRIVVKQREQEYYNWISIISAQNTIERLGDSINKIPRDQTAVIPPSTGSTISPCNVSVYPKYVNGGNVYLPVANALTSVQSIANPSGDALVTTIDNSGASVSSGLCVYETEPIESDLDIFYETATGGLVSDIPATAIDIDFFNCILLSFDPGGVGNDHIEINRIRAGYNETAFDYGVRAYVVQENFAEERRFNTLIHSSGLFNSRTGINYVNQFNESEGGLTISLDPQDGSIQKLAADDTRLLIFQENKVSNSPIDKDFIYSAEGGAVPVTSNTQFLGTIAPFVGKFGIGQNPSSYAEFGFAKYFADRNNGVIMRLSGNNLTEISNVGMSDFFRDALKSAEGMVASFDEYSGLYNLTLLGTCYDSQEDTNVSTASNNYITISFDESSMGWCSFKSFKQERGISLNNTYYSFYSGNLWQHDDPIVERNNFYNLGVQPSYIEPIFNDAPSLIKQFNTVGYEGTKGWEIEYIETDITSVGTIPTPAVSINTTLQIVGTAVNASITGEASICANQGETVSWVITASPISFAYEFTALNNEFVNQITLSGNNNVTVSAPVLNSEGNIVFQVTYVVGNSNTIQQLTVGGTGAVLANLPALLTVNATDAVALATVSPASQIFNTAGNANVIFTVLADMDYYIDPSNITINTSGLSSFNPGTPTDIRVTAASPAVSGNLDNVQYTVPLTVPVTAASGVVGVGVSGTSTAIAKTNLTWITPVATTYMTFAAPHAGTYKVSKFDTTNISATYTYSGIPTDKTMTPSSVSFAITETNGAGASVPSATGTAIDAGSSTTPFNGVFTVQLTSPTTDINAFTTITGGVVTAAIGAYAPPTPFPATPGSNVTISTTSNVDVELTRSDSWILIDGTAADKTLPVDTGFEINTTANTSGVSRQGTITVTNLNTRISPTLSPVQITIIQNG